MSPRLWRHRIKDILGAIGKIQAYVQGMDFAEFTSDPRTVDAVIRNFIVIGEAASRVPQEVIQAYPDIPWRLMADMRNFAVHEYWGVDLRTIWESIAKDLPPLIPSLRACLQDQPA